MTADSLWGPLPVTSETKPPIVFLREQAAALKELTKGILVGDVRATAAGPNLAASLDVVAPALDGYRVQIVQISHGVAFYPIVLMSSVTGQTICNDEASFVQILKRILSSPETHKIISALIAQSKVGWGGLGKG